MNFSILISLLVLHLINSTPLVDKISKFGVFKTKYGKSYQNLEEEELRFSIYSSNMDYIEKHNKLFDAEKMPYLLAENPLIDLTPEEIIRTRTGLDIDFYPDLIAPQARTTPKTKTTLKTTGKTTTKKPSEDAIDWRLKNVITPVKDQGECGSCWAFASNAALEAHLNIKNITNLNLSEQNLIDCSWDFGNHGCHCGWMTNAFNYIISNKGINEQHDYPYEAINGACRFKNDTTVATLSSYVQIPTKDEAAIERVVREIGPVTVGIDASADFVFYSSGILLSSSCSNSSVNHAVLIVGYNDTNVPPYWIIKNSWGTWYGEEGYVKVEKNKNACCIADYAYYPVI